MYDELENEFYPYTSILCFILRVWVPVVGNF